MEEFSAGGIVYRKSAKGEIEILIAQHSQHHGWVFPKGLIGDKEEFRNQTKEETALREVEEETGAEGKILVPLAPISYWYTVNDTKHHKTVYYYIMLFIDGDITKHDFEMENVEWVPVKDIAERLTYDSDKKVWKQAEKKIENL